jgi:hypothetical protein
LSWQDLGDIGEMVSAIAVVISLVYLAFQIRQNTNQIEQNTKTARATAFDSSISHAMVARQAIFENEDIARIWHKGSQDPGVRRELPPSSRRERSWAAQRCEARRPTRRCS